MAPDPLPPATPGLSLRWLVILTIAAIVGIGVGAGVAASAGPLPGVGAGIAAGITAAVGLNTLIRQEP